MSRQSAAVAVHTRPLLRTNRRRGLVGSIPFFSNGLTPAI
jgi:hypothetical protein